MAARLRPFPAAALKDVLSLPGNEKCCDCPSLDATWASVNHGIMLCLDCAGRHRSLGVQVSFVRSIYMDTWSDEQIQMMLQGGNEQLEKYFEVLKIEKAAIEKLYLLRAAGHYREKLKEKACFALLDTGLIESPLPIKSRKSRGPSSSGSVGLNHYKHICADFSEGPLGLTLNSSSNGRAVVSTVTSGSHAEKSGILPGDIIVRIGGKAATSYDDILDSLPFYARPMRIDFARCMEDVPLRRLSRSVTWETSIPQQNSGDLEDLSNSMYALMVDGEDSVNSSSNDVDEGLGDGCVAPLRLQFSPEKENGDDLVRILMAAPEVVSSTPDVDYDDWVRYFSSTYSQDIDVIVPARPLGLTLAMNTEGAAEVTAIVPGGHAESIGVLVGDIIICVNQVEHLNYDSAVVAITSSMFPLQITVRRLTSMSNVIEENKSIGIDSSDQAYIMTSSCQSENSSKEFNVEFSEINIGILVEERTVGDKNIVFVLRVLPDSSACSSGIVEGSVLININGVPCATKEMAMNAFEKMPRPIRIQFQLDLESHFAASQSKMEEAAVLNK